MNKTLPLQQLIRRAHQKKKHLGEFLKKLARRKPAHLLKEVKQIETQVWKEVDCLECSNCCRTMTPTFKKSEVKKIAEHVGMTYDQYFKKYLKIDEDNGDIVNQNQPCQHLNLRTNKCSVYAIRPIDCSGFPHLKRKDFLDQTKVYTNNLQYCPATLATIERLEKAMTTKS
ncbi:MAG: YkgJ family cysteine cluster protein [Chitinophagales bacterium]|jgi:hypothetical protein|nr:YkgJ family cysteine cluster protein [Chitinophagales bacterium]